MSGGKSWAKARDANEGKIVDALRAAGCKVHRLDGDPGVLDLLVEAPDRVITQLLKSFNVSDHWRAQRASRALHWVLIEVKNPNAKAEQQIRQEQWDTEFIELRDRLSKPVRDRLKKSQAKFLLQHSAPMAVVTSVAEALAAVGLGPEVT